MQATSTPGVARSPDAARPPAAASASACQSEDAEEALPAAGREVVGQTKAAWALEQLRREGPRKAPTSWRNSLQLRRFFALC
mmetsp:Transcript_16749/g.34089  ORF Transcript_16749/g.34089 Transcript_16749/m.34089 type:complete len:82 (+) Transcript_16749:716-961(+)